MARTQDLVRVGLTPKQASLLGDGAYTLASFGSIGGTQDVSSVIQRAITAIIADGQGTLVIPPGLHYVGSTITIPPQARNLTIMGYGAQLVGQVNGNVLKIGDTTTTDNAVQGIHIYGLTISGPGTTSGTYPNMTAIEIDGIEYCNLTDIEIKNIPLNGIVGVKPTASGSTYWEQVSLNQCVIHFIGHQGLLIGDAGAVDDFEVNDCILNHCGDDITTNSANGSSFIRAINLEIAGTEFSGNYSTLHSGFGYRWALQVAGANGLLSANHWENNCNDQAGSADLLLDTNANCLAVVGSEHYSSEATGAKFAIQTSSKANLITNVRFSGSATHTYDYIVEAGSATEPIIGQINQNGASGANTALVNYPTIGNMNPTNGEWICTRCTMGGLASYANNAAAAAAGLKVGQTYRLGDTVGVVH